MIITQFFDFTHLPEPQNLEEILNKVDLQYVFTLIVS